jgi:circadian clock protein KaiC
MPRGKFHKRIGSSIQQTNFTRAKVLFHALPIEITGERRRSTGNVERNPPQRTERKAAGEGAHGNQRPRRGDRRRPAARASHFGVRRPRLRQNGPGNGIPGARRYPIRRNGVFLAFEESAEELATNLFSMGFDLDRLVAAKKLFVDYVRVERSEIEETGEFDLEALFVRIQSAAETVGARRIVLDSLESLFAGLPNSAIVRSEMRRLFRWLKERKLTAIVTAEKGDGELTRQGLEEYVSDCVIVLDHDVSNLLFTRRLRVVKYRGSAHGTNQYPFLIGSRGIAVLPVTSLGLTHKVSSERVSSGIAELDRMLGGNGYYRGSTVLVSGTAGCGKTSVAATFARAVCQRGERCLYLAFEESPDQIVRNMRSLDIDLSPLLRKGLLQFHAERPTLCGLEMHLARINGLVQEQQPQSVVVDPITSMEMVGSPGDVKLMLMRLTDHLKGLGITTLLTALTASGEALEGTDVGVTSLVDTWLLLRDIELGGERNRGLYVLKSRGMAHSNQIREFLITNRGIRLCPTYIGPEGALTGSARLTREAHDQTEQFTREQQIKMLRLQLKAKERTLAAQVAGLQAQFKLETEQLKAAIAGQVQQDVSSVAQQTAMAISRGVSPGAAHGRRNGGPQA